MAPRLRKINLYSTYIYFLQYLRTVFASRNWGKYNLNKNDHIWVITDSGKMGFHCTILSTEFIFEIPHGKKFDGTIYFQSLNYTFWSELDIRMPKNEVLSHQEQRDSGRSYRYSAWLEEPPNLYRFQDLFFWIQELRHTVFNIHKNKPYNI